MEILKLIDTWFSSFYAGGLYLLVIPNETTFDLDCMKIATMQNFPRNGVCVEIRDTGYGSKSAILQELARAFLFPSYFGLNWDALEECLTDLNWLPADCYCMILNDAMHVLEKYDEDRGILFNILADVSTFWLGQPKPVAFITFISCKASEEQVMLDRLKHSKSNFKVIRANNS